jgi:hydrogenase-4 component E
VSTSLFDQLIGLAAGVLLLTSALLVWKRSLVAAVRLLAVQGVALATIVAVIAVYEQDLQLLAVAGLVLALKGAALPWALDRSRVRTGGVREETPLMNTTSSLLALSLLTMLAYLVGQPLLALSPGPAATAVPVGLSLVLYGFLILTTRRHAISQLVGFLVLDNGIATVAFLTSGGVPLVVELGASLDVLLVVLVLRVLSSRITTEFGDADLDDLTELRD